MSNSRQPGIRLSGITKAFEDVVANDDVDFTLSEGSVHALVGENGAGKTTLMSILYGLYQPDSGIIEVDGTGREFDSPRDAIDAGIGMIHQHFQLVDNMTVLQNIVLGHEPSKLGLVDETDARADVEEICSTYGFDVDEHLDTPVEELGVGVQQRVEIVKSLYRGAETLILDEPTAVLTPKEVLALFRVMEKLRERGRSLVFITHKLDEAMNVADRITILRDGEVVGTVATEETSRDELARMMVGRDVLFQFQTRDTTPGEVTLEVEGLTVQDDRGLEQVSNVDFEVRRGEIFGIAGVQGNGQEELIEAVTGLRDVEEGTVSLDGDLITDLSRRERIEAGISYIPEDRQADGIVMHYDLVRNALLGNQTLEPFTSDGVVDWTAVRDHAEDVIEEFDVEPMDPDATATALSGGNQQKLIVGREFEKDPGVLVASHPTRGVDVGSIEFIHNQLREMRDDGTAILFVSSKLDEIQKLSDRVAVMYEGKFVNVVDPDDVTEHELGQLMTGQTLREIKRGTETGSGQEVRR